MTDERVNAFLADLRALTIKHGLKIEGCGCCGSPWLDDRDVGEGAYVIDEANYDGLADNLKWKNKEAPQ